MTERQKFALQWLQQNHQSKFRWLRNGKNAYGPPDKWDTMEISGTDGSIRIPVADWEALHPYMRTSSYEESGKGFMPNDAGIEAMRANAEQMGSK